jgi:hypothetical protein
MQEAMVVMRSQYIPPQAKAVESSVIRETFYAADKRELRITFVSGRQYAYANVPQSIYEAFLASASKGAFFNIAIRGRYHFHEILPVSEPTAH